MTLDSSLHLDFGTFLRKFEQRAQSIMWLLGAGSSRASGIPTADDMIWEFKSRIYSSEKRTTQSSVQELGDETTRSMLQKFFDEQEGAPALYAPNEYSYYFERAYPDSQDRGSYIGDKVRGAKPTYGHLALAALIKLDLARIVWTTNFDGLIEDAVAKEFETSSVLTVGDLGEPERVRRAVSQTIWPICAKLHGDFRSTSLKNTVEELSKQDAEMRRIFIETCRTQGLAITGYSGRDLSILDALTTALNKGSGFPNGLFWVIRSQDNIFPPVIDLITRAKDMGIDAAFVKAESFDELFDDIIRYLPKTSRLRVEIEDKRKMKPRAIELDDKSQAIPFIRTNAIPVLEYPKTCRLVDCDVGGKKEIDELIKAASSELVAARTKKGVVAFGDDEEIQRVFSKKNIKSLDTHGILPDRLYFETGERTLLRDALYKTLAEHCGLPIHRRRIQQFFLADDQSRFGFDSLKYATKQLSGVLKDGTKWREACSIRIDYHLDQLWILLGPFVDLNVEEDASEIAREFVRERRASRFNKQSNDILDGWVKAVLGPDRENVNLRFEGGTGIGARFELSHVTAFSGLSK